MGRLIYCTSVLLALLTSTFVKADAFKQVVDIYLSSQCGDALLLDVQRQAEIFGEMQLLGTTEEDNSYHDRIRIVEHGIPLDLKIETAAANQEYFYFLSHKSISEVYADFFTQKNLMLKFQKLVASPGHFVKTDGTSGRWYRHAFPNITGIFLTPIDAKISAEFIARFGTPLHITLKSGTPIIKLQEDLVVIPGRQSESAISVAIRELTDAEKSRWLAPAPSLYYTGQANSHRTAH